MKIQIEESNKKRDFKFPTLFDSIDGDRIVLLVTRVDKLNNLLEGTAVYSDDDSIKEGEYSETWSLEDFEICNVGFKITLEQE